MKLTRTEGNVRVSVNVHVEQQSTRDMTRRAAGGIATGAGLGVIVAFRGVVACVGTGVWLVARALECSAAVALAFERLCGGHRNRIALMYWRQQPTEQTGIEVYRGQD